MYQHCRQELYRSLRDCFDAYFLERMDDWRHRLGTLSELSVAGTGGSRVTLSVEAAVASPQASSSVLCDAASTKGVSPGTPPPSSAVTIDKSLLV